MRILKPNFERRDGLVVVIAQDVHTGEVLMQAYTNEAGFLETLATGKAVYWSTSRGKRWCKGEESGDFQIVKDVIIDCDGDTVILKIEQLGNGACHTKARGCFYRSIAAERAHLSPAPKEGDKEKLTVIEVDVVADLAALLMGSGH